MKWLKLRMLVNGATGHQHDQRQVAADVPAKFQCDAIILITNLVASKLHDILQ